MQKVTRAGLGLLLMASAAWRGWAVDPVWECAVQVSATAQAAPPRITLSWPQDVLGTPNQYTVYRRAPGASSWGSGTGLPGNTTTYFDDGVAVGGAYEYQIVKNSSGRTGSGYIYAGIQAPLIEQRGKVLLLVDSTFTSPLASELARLQEDLVGDGWTLLRRDVARNDSVVNVKNLIRTEYNADPANLKAVFLFGHIPVPYSGLQNPDGHEDHYGAWPADVYYGDVDGNWTDNTINFRQTINTDSAECTRLSNVPGDGKFDQLSPPSTVELQVGRVDLANLPGRTSWGGPATFPNEVELMRRYLNKHHNFRHKLLNPRRRAVVGDYFGTRDGEAFAASGFRSFAPIFGATNVVNLNILYNDQRGVWIPHLAANDYLFAYGCGAGSYLTIGGLGNSGQYFDGSTVEIVNNDVRAAFGMLFGSWLGDWDHEDDILRAFLATPTYGLAAVWSGRPHWFAHHLGLGEPIGYSTRLTQNNRNNGPYLTQVNSSAGGIHIALMGDPTLRLHPVAPPGAVSGTASQSGNSLNWSPSPDSVLGYHVYRASNPAGPFARVSVTPVTSTSFIDANPLANTTHYMVRALKLETTGSGSYTNASQGIFRALVNGNATGGTPTNSPPPPVNPPATNITTIPNVTSSNAVTWFDDALPAGAGGGATGGDAWTWVNTPAPVSGSLVHQSSLGSGLHEHFFNWAGATLTVNAGETLFTYVYLDPANPPTELMLSFNADSWEHRAYWGENVILYGANGTPGRRYLGPLPPPGQWVRLEVPANLVALEGRTLTGMGFSLFDGRATWDYTGKATTSTTTSNAPSPTVTVTAADATAAEPGTDRGVFRITRSGSTATALTVNYSIGGTAVSGTDFTGLGTSVTIPAGTGSADVTVIPSNDSIAEPAETVLLTLVANAAYTLGTPSSASVTIADDDSSTPPPPANPPPTATNNPPSSGSVSPAKAAAYSTLTLPKAGENRLRIISPTLLEVCRINSKAPNPAAVDSWDLVTTNNQFRAPALSEFAVKVNGQAATVQAVGFKRRPLYAPLAVRDLRIENCLYLRLANPIADGQSVEVKNPSGALWPASMQFTATADPSRLSPVLHVNQEGYVPTFPKKAMVGYYLGSFGELDLAASLGFKLVDATNGAQVFQGNLKARPEVGSPYSPMPYQKVLEADFTSFNTPGEYCLLVPGIGASLPFRIDDGVAMAFTRAYALGLYHQRCGTNNTMPFTRHIHDVCHAAPAEIPTPQASFANTWNVIASESAASSSNPRQTAPQLKDEASQLYPFINKNPIDVSRGHHDAGDYSKYTINSAGLIHYLMFTVDSIPRAASLDNLGLPESGDGTSDLMQAAKWEADFLAKLQDADGGFYFLVYPRNRRYENNVTPDHGDPQIVWPKNTAVTAAAVGALAQCASSPNFKAKYPADAARYLQKAQLGWKFLTNAIARYGKDGSYQRITSYGDEFMHDDELAWAACEMFLATGNAAYHQKLKEWFPDPSDSGTYRWGWWRLWQSYGATIRSYAFASRNGRLDVSRLDAAYLAKCESEILAAANDALTWSRENPYGTSFPSATKRVKRAGWYFSSDHGSDLAAAYQLNPRPEYLEGMLANMNYEGGCNPVNASYVTGLGWKRQREIVHQYAQNDRRVLPPSGIPLGNIQEGFYYVNTYQGELNGLCFPQDWTDASPYPFYDRWGDAFNVMTEFVHLNQARSLMMFSLLSSFTWNKGEPWKFGKAEILVPYTVVPVGQPTTLGIQGPGLDFSGARILWEGRDQEPAYGMTYPFTPKNNGPQWVEMEAQWPDGRRVFATNIFVANSPVVTWVDDAIPTGAAPGSNGGDGWSWVSSPAPFAGNLAHQSTINAGLHEHYFDNTSATLEVSAGDTLFAYVYLDPANPPQQIMLQWNDGSWEHRAYWGSNLISYGSEGTTSRRSMGTLPAAGQWVRLEVPASAVGLEGHTLKGMAFSLFGGRATFDNAGKASAAASGLQVGVRRLPNNRVGLSWSSVAGKTYRVAVKNSITSTNWTDVSGDLNATGTSTSWTNTIGTAPGQGFYRVYRLN